jgi:hypothetical protein
MINANSLALLLLIPLLSSPASALNGNPCPNLTGRYGCVARADQLDILTIAQTEGDGFTEYFTRYNTVGSGNQFRASENGIRDDFGWINQCAPGGRLSSTLHDGSATAELYLDSRKALVRTYQGRVLQTCTRLD